MTCVIYSCVRWYVCLLCVHGSDHAEVAAWLPVSTQHDSWLLRIMNEVLNVFLSRVSLMEALWGNTVHTHTDTHRSQQNIHTHPHISLIFSPSFLSCLVQEIPLLPSEWIPSRAGSSTHFPGSCLAPAHLAPPHPRLFSSSLHRAWFWEAQKLDSFTPKQKGFDGDGPREWSPDCSKRPSCSQLSQGDFQKAPRTWGQSGK